MADSRLNLLSWSLGVVVLSLSAQDVAVDAWAVELIPRRKLAYVAACQTIGMSAGNVLGPPLLLACPHDGHTLRRFCTAIASAHAMAALAATLTSETTPASERRPRLRETWHQLRSLASGRATLSLGVVCLWQRLTAVSLDASAAIFYMKLPGARQQDLAAFALVQAPIGLLSSLVVARLLANQQSDTAAAMRAGFALLLVSGAAMPLLLSAHVPHSSPMSTVALFLLSAVFAAGNKIWWTAQATAFNYVAVQQGSAATHALHLQLLNSLSNMGKFWPRPLALTLVDAVGFAPSSLLLAGAGLLAWPSMRSALQTLREKTDEARSH